MQDITLYLKKYAKIGLKELKIKEFLGESIKEICGIDVDKEKLDIQSNQINIKVIGTEKSEIYMKLEQIEELFIKKIEQGGYTKIERKFL